MLKKDFTYKNIDGEEVTETWYFNLSTAELAKMHLTADGDIVAHLKNVVASKNGKTIIAAFEDVIRRSVGRRGGPDGKSFVKSPAIADEFMGSEAYSDFFITLVTDAHAAAEFINGVMPGDLAEKARAIQDANLPDPRVAIENGSLIQEVPQRQPLTVDAFSMDELLEMSREDLDLLNGGKLFDKPGAERPLEDYDRSELLGMSDEKFTRLVGTDSKKWPKEVLAIAMMRRTRKK